MPPASEREGKRFSVQWFEEEFRRRLAEGRQGLNPREALALPHVRGTVLDLGCGLGNFAIEAARRGCEVTAVDASRVAVERLRDEAARLGLRIRVIAADLEGFRPDGAFDGVVCIGVLMFFQRDRARSLLRRIQDAVAPGGVAVVSALAEGTTYMEMFEPPDCHLFGPKELESSFAGWTLLVTRTDEVAAPQGTRKVFSTVIARRA